MVPDNFKKTSGGCGPSHAPSGIRAAEGCYFFMMEFGSISDILLAKADIEIDDSFYFKNTYFTP